MTQKEESSIKEAVKEAVKLKVEELTTAHAIDLNNEHIQLDTRFREDLAGAMVMSLHYWFARRKLQQDYVWRHPRNYRDLFLHWLSRWIPFLAKYIDWREVRFSFSEAYHKIALPEYKPEIIVEKFEDGLSVNPKEKDK